MRQELEGLQESSKQLASTIDEKTSAIDELRNQLESAKSSLQHERETSNYKISDLSKDLDREVGEKRTMQVRLEAQDEKIGDMKALLAVCQSQLESRTAAAGVGGPAGEQQAARFHHRREDECDR
uniref:Uncharacterized protein n=1 Tax=Guillardia theta TaxID=55529 RepID=A0A7S4KCD3_GUITH